MSRISGLSGCFVIVVVSIAAQLAPGVRCSANVTREEVERAIREGVRYLKGQQRADGSWSDVENEAKTGTTSLITLALLTAGEKIDSPTIHRALNHLRGYKPNDLKSTYAIALQTMVFAAAQPENDQLRIADNVSWLERAQIKPADPVKWAGSWTYSDSKRTRPGDNSNTQYALLGLHAASEVGVPVKPAVWELARAYWERSQKQTGGWAYTPDSTNQTASMTCARVSSLIITGLRSRYQGQVPSRARPFKTAVEVESTAGSRRESTGRTFPGRSEFR